VPERQHRVLEHVVEDADAAGLHDHVDAARPLHDRAHRRLVGRLVDDDLAQSGSGMSRCSWRS
jgi:hypothetical protein